MKKQKNISEIRSHYFLDDKVIIAPGRKNRPSDGVSGKLKPRGGCPFCPKNIQPSDIIDYIGPSQTKWQTACLTNRFSAVDNKNMEAYGYQEVIIDSPEHKISPGDLSVESIQNLLVMYARRTTHLAKDKKINYVLCFKNHGIGAGASLSHIHSQVFATKLIPCDLRLEAKKSAGYYAKHQHCPYCDILKNETHSERKIYSDKYVLAFTPYASSFHYEAWIFPHRHLDNITELSSAELKSMAKVLKKIFKKLDSLGLSYNYFLHNVIPNKHQHFYIKIQPRESVWGGVELGSGLIINTVSPEDAASYYRKK